MSWLCDFFFSVSLSIRNQTTNWTTELFNIERVIYIDRTAWGESVRRLRVAGEKANVSRADTFLWWISFEMRVIPIFWQVENVTKLICSALENRCVLLYFSASSKSRANEFNGKIASSTLILYYTLFSVCKLDLFCDIRKKYKQFAAWLATQCRRSFGLSCVKLYSTTKKKTFYILRSSFEEFFLLFRVL